MLMIAVSVSDSDDNNIPLPVSMRQRDFKALAEMFDEVDAEQMRCIEAIVTHCLVVPPETSEEMGSVVIDPSDYTLEIFG